MNDQPKIVNGTLFRCKRVWLLTWEWAGDHAKIEDKVVALLDYRCSDRTVERIVEQTYVSSRFAYHEQLAYAISKKHTPYRIQHGTIEVDRELRERHSLPERVPTSDELIYGNNPWLWARIVYDAEAYVDENGKEHLRWKERNRSVWKGSTTDYSLEERHWSR